MTGRGGWLWIFVASALVATGCSSNSPADLSTPPARVSPMDEQVTMRAMDQEEGGDPAAAIQIYSQVIEQEPHAVDAYYARGKVHQSTGNHAQAEADFNVVLRHKPRSAAAYFSRGQSMQAQGKHHQALVSYSLAIAVEPRQAKWYYLRSRAYQALADEADASGESGRAAEMRQRAEQNFAIAKGLDPITDFTASESKNP